MKEIKRVTCKFFLFTQELKEQCFYGLIYLILERQTLIQRLYSMLKIDLHYEN